jgi:hypothetical protein
MDLPVVAVVCHWLRYNFENLAGDLNHGGHVSPPRETWHNDSRYIIQKDERATRTKE